MILFNLFYKFNSTMILHSINMPMLCFLLKIQINLNTINNGYNKDIRMKQMGSVDLSDSFQNISSSLVIIPTQHQIHEEGHIQIGEFLKSFIYGGVDGIMNILCIIVSSTSSQQSTHTIMALGVAATIAGAIDMGLADYVSFQAEQSFIALESQREAYEIDNMFEEEVSEIYQIFKKIDFSDEDSKELSRLFSQNKSIFLKVMMLHELGLVVSGISPWKMGFVNFFAFIICGMPPIMPYIIANSIKSSANMLLPALLIGFTGFISLGIVKANVIHQEGWVFFKTVLEIVSMGSVVVVVSYGIGFIFR